MSAGGGGGSGSATSRFGGKHTSKVRSRQLVSTGLMLTSMLDILTTILFFLMKNYSSVQSDFSVGKDLSLPYSTAVIPPMPALQIVVSKNDILLDNMPIAKLVNGDIERKDLLKDGITIVPLAQRLKAQKDRSLYLEKHNDAHSFTGTIVMQADKDLPFSVLKKVIFTASMSDFNIFKLAVLKENEG